MRSGVGRVGARRQSVLCMLALVALAACVPPPAPSPSGAQLPDPIPAALDRDDLVSVRVFAEESLSGEFRVGDDGQLRFPLIGTIQAAGLTAPQLADALRAALADGYLNDPQVGVDVVEFNSRKISVIGEVKSPGRYAWRDGITLVEAIAEAGGTTPSAALSYVQITRTRPSRKQFTVPYRDITLGRVADFPLLVGDVVLVQESAVR